MVKRNVKKGTLCRLRTMTLHSFNSTPDRRRSRTDERVDEKADHFIKNPAFSEVFDFQNGSRRTRVNRFRLPDNRFRPSKTLCVIKLLRVRHIYFSFRTAAYPV